MNTLEIKNLKYSYMDGEKEHYVLKGINCSFESGKLYVIVGESGSGKTSLLSLMSGLDSYKEGEILYNNENINKIGLGNYRLKYSNVIFQSYNLITYMTAKENVDVAIDISKIKKENNDAYAYELLEQVGIDKEKANRNVLKLSGGEQQRVAIARSIAGDVPMIFCDEPTGSLDEETEDKIINIFKELAKDGKIVIVVSHSKNVASKADVVIKLKDGKITK